MGKVRQSGHMGVGFTLFRILKMLKHTIKITAYMCSAERLGVVMGPRALRCVISARAQTFVGAV